MEYRNDGTIYQIGEVMDSLLSDDGLRNLSAKAQPLGLFYMDVSSEDEYGFSRKRYLGIDNSTGEAWKKYFSTLRECKHWLRESQAHHKSERQKRNRETDACGKMTRNEKYLKIRELLEMRTQGCHYYHGLPLPEKTKQYIDDTCLYEWFMPDRSVYIFPTNYGRFGRDRYQGRVIDRLFNGRASEYSNISDSEGKRITVYINRPLRAFLYVQLGEVYAVLEFYHSDEDAEVRMQELYFCQQKGDSIEYFELPSLFPLRIAF